MKRAASAGVGTIQTACRPNHERVRQRPRKAQPPRNPQRRRRPGPGAAVFDEDDAVRPQAARIDRVEEAPGRVRLQGPEPESPLRIAGDDEADDGVAEVADAVKKDNGPQLVIW
jgi:hypothetical protein